MIETFAYVEINLFALIILLLIYINMQHLEEKVLYRQKLFTALLFSSAIQLILDSILWTLDKAPGLVTREIVITATVLYFVNSSIPFFLWSLYVDYQVYRNTRKTKKLILPMVIPAAINAVLAVLSCFTGYYFRYDTANAYHRGNLFYFSIFLWMIYFVHTTVVLVRNHKKMERRHFLPMIFFMIPVLAAGIIQLLFFGISIIWAGLAISIQIVFMSIQTGQLNTDYLTGLYNRRQLDNYLEDLEKSSNRGMITAGIMLDLDSFKEINDLYGHVAGDQAIINAARILKMSFRKKDMVCRYGGDEFVVILERAEKLEVVQAVERIYRNVLLENAREKLPYTISFSIGYDIFDSKSGMTANEFLEHIDSLMYQNKKSMKAVSENSETKKQ